LAANCKMSASAQISFQKTLVQMESVKQVPLGASPWIRC
jgi:hypothetical protein